MDEKVTFELFRDFLYEAFDVLKVKEDDRLTCVAGIMMVGEKCDPIGIIAEQKKLYFFPAIFCMLYKGYKPTPIRLAAYGTANRWKRFIETGMFSDYTEDDNVCAVAISTLKGLQLFDVPVPPVDFDEVRKKVYLLSGMAVELKSCPVEDGSLHTFVCVKDQSLIADSERVLTLMQEESVSIKPLESIPEGEKGSKTNPFNNVDEAAEYILELEKQRLKGDRYREFISSRSFFVDPECRIFRIPWASPLNAYMGGDEVKPDGFVVNQILCRDPRLPYRRIFNLKPCLWGHKFLFRGQAEFYPECVPNIFRRNKNEYLLKYHIFTCEMELLLNSHPMVQLFNEGFELFNDKFPIEINYNGLSQHYYNRTQFLDLTSQMDAAKFFAVTTFNFDENRYEPYTGPKLGVLYYYDIEPDAFAGLKQGGCQLSTIGKQPFMRSGAQHGFLLYMSRGLDFNKLPQVRWVYFKHDPNVTKRIYAESKEGDLYQADDILQDYWYGKLNDPYLKNRVCMEAVELNHRYNPQKSVAELIELLKAEGISVHNEGVPVFSETALDRYFYSRVNTYWSDFCRDIYFYSPEGKILRECLLNLPSDPRYRTYFHKSRMCNDK